MILTVPGPKDSVRTPIEVKDIIRLETCVLEFFGKKLFNLYIVVRANEGENFHLFSYVNLDRFKAAFSGISMILRDRNSTTIKIIQVDPTSHSEPMTERENLQPAL